MKKKKTYQDFMPLPDPVWDDNGRPTPFFFEWFQRVAEIRLGNKNRWLDAARDLGYYGVCYYEGVTGRVEEGPIGFVYDPALYRKTLGISNDMPIISNNGENRLKPIWDLLLSEE